MKKSEDIILKLLKLKMAGRKLALRWKDFYMEQLLATVDLKADIYVSDAEDRIDNISTFPSEYLSGKQDKYYLLIPSLPQSKADILRYRAMGFEETEDVLWINHLPVAYKEKDPYGNIISSESDVNILFKGYGADVSIGKNVHYPAKSTLLVYSDNIIRIENNVNMSGCKIDMLNGAELHIGTNVHLGGARIFLNIDGKLTIGDFCTFGDGRIRSGRNQSIIIGNDCMFSWDITLLAHDGHLIFDLNTGTCTNNTRGVRNESIIIGNHVWVGGETAVLPNTYIADGSICGYRSLVKGKFPNNCVIAGSPAKVIKKNIAWRRENACLSDEALYSLPEEYRKKTEDVNL